MTGNLKKSKSFYFYSQLMPRVRKYADIGPIKYKKENEARNIEVIWISGPTGSGKSLITHCDRAWSLPYANGKFQNWEQYNVDAITLDHLHFGDIPITKVIEIIDACRFNSSPLTSTVNKIYLVSLYPPRQSFSKRQKWSLQFMDELEKRITKYITLDKSLPDKMTKEEIKEFVSQYIDEEE